ncbi:hypothetical protein Tco_0609103 [Tanacetum coccineum]
MSHSRVSALAGCDRLVFRAKHSTQQAATIDTESEPEEAPSKTEELQPLVARTKPPSSDHTPTSSDPTLVSPFIDEEFEAFEPSNTRTTSSHSTTPLNSTTLLSPDHPLTQTSPTPTLSRPLLTEAMALSPSSFRKRYRSSYDTPSSSASPSPSPTLPIRKRYRGTSEPILDTETAAQGVTPVEVTTADRPLGLGYGAARRRALEIAEEITPSTFEIRHSSRSAPDQQVADETPIPRIPARTTWIDPEMEHVMSTSAHIDSETISQTDRARSSRVPIPLHDDPYMTVRHAYLATTTGSESEPVEDFRETKIPQLLPIASSPVPPSDDTYLIVGNAHTPTAIDTESEPKEAPSETEELQPLVTRTSPLSSDHTPTSSDPTPVLPLTNKEFEASEPSDTRITSSHSTAPSDSTTPLSPDHPLTHTTPTLMLSQPLYYCRTTRMAVRTQPTLSLGFSTRLTEAMALSPSSFCKRYRSSYETSSSSASPAPSLILPIRKRYWGTFEPILGTKTEDDKSEAKGADSGSEESEDAGPDSEGEDAAPKGQQQQAAPVEVITAYRPLGLGYVAAKHRALEIAEEIAPSTFEIGQSSRSTPDQQVVDETLTPRIPARSTWINAEDGTICLDIEIDPLSRAPFQTPTSPELSSGFLPVSPASLTVPSPVASPTTTPIATIAVDEDEFLEVGVQLELHRSILYDHTQRLDASTFLEGHGRDVTELFDRSRAVREEIHSQRFRLRSLELAQEQVTFTFGTLWRLVLALEAWAGQTDAQRAAMWQARYEDHRLIHDLLVQNAAMQRELQELRDCVTTLEK